VVTGHRSQSDKGPGGLRGEVLRFALVGAAATCAHYGVALLLARHLNLYGANLLGYLAAVAISYFGHQRYSFRVAPGDISHQRQLPRFIAGSLGGLALSYLLLALMKDLLGAPAWLSLAVAVGLVPVYTFLFNKLWVFRTVAVAERQ
jgi:putative flippase GtrA